MKKAKPAFFVLIFITAAITIFLIYRYSQQEKTSPPIEMIPVRLGSVPSITEGLSHAAFEEGFFAEQGLDVTLKINPDGKSNLTDVLSGEVDIGATMSTPVIYQALERDDFQIIAKVRFDKPIHEGIGRIDHGITDDPQSIIGKKVATLTGTSAFYHFDSWLLYNGIDYSQFELVELSAPDGLQALVDGEIDAMFYWFPFNEMARQALVENTVPFSGGDLVPSSWVYVAKKEYIEQHPDVIEKFLKALFQAEELYQEQPDIVFADHAKYSGIEESVIASIFSGMNYQVMLDQALLLDMEYQTEWIRVQGYATVEPMPYFLDFVYPDAMKTVNPAAMTIILGD